MVVFFTVIAVLTALAVFGVIYVVIHDLPPRPPSEDDQTGLLIAGIVMMFLFPLGGFIAGCILLSKRALQGTLVMLVSVVMGLAYGGFAIAWLAGA